MTFRMTLLVCVQMLNANSSGEEIMDLISEDEEMTLRQDRHCVAECLRHSPIQTWIFTGQYAMPNCEHLIPFRT